MENVLQIIGVILIVLGALVILRALLRGMISLAVILIPAIIIFFGVYLLH